jgi:hypothetical protein
LTPIHARDSIRDRLPTDQKYCLGIIVASPFYRTAASNGEVVGLLTTQILTIDCSLVSAIMKQREILGTNGDIKQIALLMQLGE